MSGDELIPIGVDLGSLHARVAIGNVSHQNVPPKGNTDTRPLPNIISNAQGSRYTLALVGSESISSEGDASSDAIRHIFGEAARRALAREKKPTISKDPSSMVREMIKSSSSVDGGDSDKSSAAAAFFGHLADLACDASSSHPSKLRAVVSVNVGASPEEQAAAVETIEAGVIEALKARSDMKKKKKGAESIVVGVISDPVAVCIAHGLTEVQNATIDFTSPNPQTWKNALVVDWGASGLTATHICRASPNSSLLKIMKHATETGCSGTAIVNAVVSHCASMFERKNRISGVLDSVKAHHRLELACESAVRALSRAPTTAVSIDGLYEGIDLNVPISRPRFDMMVSGMLKKAETLLQSFSEGLDNFDVVLLAGNVCDMPSATNLIRTKLFPDASAGRNDVPADEAIAIGCARHATSVLSCQTYSKEGGKSTDKTVGLTTRKAKACPINIGIAKNDDKENAVPLIEVGQALPANTTRSFASSGEGVVIVQMSGGITKSSKVLGRIEKLPTDTNFEITMELSATGKLSLSVNGGPMVSL